MGCVVGTPTVAKDSPRGTRSSPAEYPGDGKGSRVASHAEKPASSPLPKPLHIPLDGSLKGDNGSGSEGQPSITTAVTQPYHAPATNQHKNVEHDLNSSSGEMAPAFHATGTSEGNNTASTANYNMRYASRHSKLTLHGSPFLSSPMKQQRLLSLGSELAHTASASASASTSPLAGTSGCDGVSGGGGGSRGTINANAGAASGSARFASAADDNNTQPVSSRHCCSSTTSTSNHNHAMRESMLSDISATLSTISATGPSASELASSSYGSPLGGGGGRNSIKTGLFRNGEDLEAQRQQAPLNIEEDLFIYDDIVISKDEARTKHWRLAGRKPAVAMDLSLMDGSNNPTGWPNSRSNSLKGKRFFTFNDFDVCVDEMDWMPATTTGTTNCVTPLQQSTDTASTMPDLLKSMTITSTVATAPNTVAHFMAEARLKDPKSNRPLRGFHADAVLGHATRVKCIALSPSETEFASCSNEDASISLNNLGVKGEVGIFTGHQDTIINAIFSPDGKYLATTSKDRTMILWDVMTTKNLLTFTHPKVVICCSFGPDSKYLVSGCQDRICRLWDTKRGKEWLSYTGHEGIIISIAFSPDGNYVCSASADKSLRVWSATTAKTRFHLTGHTGIILSCSYTADGRHIISNDESLLRVWSAEDGQCTLSLSPVDVTGATLLSARGPKLGWTLSSAAPGAFTGYMLVACNNRFVYVLDIETGKEVTNTFCKAPVYCLTSGSYEKMACGDSFGNIYILTLT